MKTNKIKRRKKELHTGIDGSGKPVYIVATVHESGKYWVWQERFSILAEAESWMKYA